MEHASDARIHSSRPGYLAEVTLAFIYIRDTRASGRLSLRNGEQFGLVHLYFNAARLIHVTGDKRNGEIILNDLLNWSRGSVRFDSGSLVAFESLTWQQAQIFGRWLTFLEMRGRMQGIAPARLDGLARSLMARLPGEPIALPDEVEYHEEYEAEARARQWQRFNEGVQQLVERALTEEQREQLRQVAQQVTLRVNQVVQQAGESAQDFARRASKATQEGWRQVSEAAQEMARQGTSRAEEIVKQTLSKDRRQQMLESTQRTVESVAEAAQEVARQGTLRAEELLRSPLPPELQALSIRHRSAFRSPSPATGHLGEGQ